LCDDNTGDDGNHNANVDEPDLEEESSDSKNDGIPNFIDDICNMVGRVKMSSKNNISICGTRK
jgi:hypothetical protein